MTPKEKFILFCGTNENIPIFFKPNWLDAVTSGNWDVILALNNEGDILAFMPICFKDKYMFTAIHIPLLTPYSGIWIRDEVLGDQTLNFNANKRKIIQDIVSQLKDVDYFRVNFHYNFDMWLPFYHLKYKQTTHYTYLLNHLKNIDMIWEGFKGSVKNKIRKAEKMYSISESDDINPLYSLCLANFEKQKIKLPFSLCYLESLNKSVLSNRKIFFVKDQYNNIVAAQYLVWDEGSAYNLLLAIDEKHKSMGVGPLILWHSIQYASLVTNVYDFEGSMLPGVQPFFESFGGKHTPYFQIYKIKNPFLKIWFNLTGKI